MVEIATYANYALPHKGGKCLVLGMTPELRKFACNFFSEVVSVDASPDAIKIYRDWVSGENEVIFLSDWFGFLESTKEYFDVIIGDGVFGNLAGSLDAIHLLSLVRSRLTHEGSFINRFALMPENYQDDGWRLESLLKFLREKKISECDFGLTARLLSQAHLCYDPKMEILDCAKSFALLRDACRRDELTALELDFAERFLFEGMNWLPVASSWHSMLEQCEFDYKFSVLEGNLWYEYYPVYKISKI